MTPTVHGIYGVNSEYIGWIVLKFGTHIAEIWIFNDFYAFLSEYIWYKQDNRNVLDGLFLNLEHTMVVIVPYLNNFSGLCGSVSRSRIGFGINGTTGCGTRDIGCCEW